MELLRPAEAARRLGISRTSLWRIAKSQSDFPRFFHLAGCRTTVIDGDELGAWVARQKSHATRCADGFGQTAGDKHVQ